MALLGVRDSKADWVRGAAAAARADVVDGVGGSDAKFMALLSGYDDAISLANQELKQLAALKSGPAVNAKKFRLANVVGYCKYQKLTMVMGRNEDLANGILLRLNEKRGGGEGK